MFSRIHTRLFSCSVLAGQVVWDFPEFHDGGFEVFDDVRGKEIGIGKIVGLFEAIVSEPKNVDAGIVVDEKPACPHFSPLDTTRNWRTHGMVRAASRSSTDS
jgi:hypothetical protein